MPVLDLYSLHLLLTHKIVKKQANLTKSLTQRLVLPRPPYDLPTYVLHVLGHFWMFAVKITEWLFSLKSLGLWTHLPIVWDKVPNKFGFFLHLP